MTKKEKKFVVPTSGSLGLLATGYAGLVAWREAKAAEAKKATPKKKKENES